MSEPVCVFVDGENFRHAIVELFKPQFGKADYLPDTDWALVFDWFVAQACPTGKRKRTYWYVIEHLDFYPYRFPDARQQPDSLKKLLAKDPSLCAQLRATDPAHLATKLQDMSRDLIQDMTRMKKRFEGWTRVQESIALKNPAITFRRAGGITYDLFTKQLGREKAVDVKLACDLILLRDMYETAVIVSGDQDYVPAVEAIKDFGKSVCNVAFRTRGGILLPGGARRLNIATDRCVEIPHDEFARYLGFK